MGVVLIVELVDIWNYWDGPTEGVCRVDGHLHFFVCTSDVLKDEPREFAYYDLPLDQLIRIRRRDLMEVLSEASPDGYFMEDELQKALT